MLSFQKEKERISGERSKSFEIGKFVLGQEIKEGRTGNFYAIFLVFHPDNIILSISLPPEHQLSVFLLSFKCHSFSSLNYVQFCPRIIFFSPEGQDIEPN